MGYILERKDITDPDPESTVTREPSETNASVAVAAFNKAVRDEPDIEHTLDLEGYGTVRYYYPIG